VQGVVGPQGPPGSKGDQGLKGDTGIGIAGPQGSTGDTGPQGLKGDKGGTGSQGLKGDAGTAGAAGGTGPTGATGLTGDPGVKGEQGDPGAKGANGTNGSNGAKGDTGDKGNTGNTGAQGPIGNNGLDPYTFRIAAASDSMSVSIDRFVSGTFDLNLWIKLLQLRYNDATQSCDQFIVGGIDMFNLINGKRDTANTEVNNLLLLKQPVQSWLSTSSFGRNLISTGSVRLAIPTPNTVDTYHTESLIIWGPNTPEKLGVVEINTKCLMALDLEVSGIVKSGGYTVTNTNTAYSKSNTYSRAEVGTPVAIINTKLATNTAGISTINSTITTMSSNVNSVISAVDTLNSESYLKPISGVNSYLTLDSRFRIYTNTTNMFSIQRLDNDGSIITDAWLDLMKIEFNSNTNKTTAVIINGEDILAKMTSTVADPYTVASPIEKALNVVAGKLSLRMNDSYFDAVASPFWCAGRFSGSNLSKVGSSGRVSFDVERGSGFAAGVYKITCLTHPRGSNHITNATASAVQCGVMNDPNYTPTSTTVHLFARAATGVLADCEMNFMILA
jgi:hypothetical protein